MSKPVDYESVLRRYLDDFMVSDAERTAVRAQVVGGLEPFLFVVKGKPALNRLHKWTRERLDWALASRAIPWWDVASLEDQLPHLRHAPEREGKVGKIKQLEADLAIGSSPPDQFSGIILEEVDGVPRIREGTHRLGALLNVYPEQSWPTGLECYVGRP